MKAIGSSGARVVIAAAALAIAVVVYAGAHGSLGGQTAALAGQEAPAAGARHRLEVEAAIARADLVERVEAALGGAFAGVWFEPSTAQLHVGVTSSASGAAVEAVAAQTGLVANVLQTPVRSTWEQLVAAQQRLSRHLDDLFARAEVATALRPELNSVEVELGSAVPSSRRVDLEKTVATVDVDVLIAVASNSHLRLTRGARCNEFAEKEAYCDPTIVAGVRVEAETACAAGPAVLPQDHTKTTETYLLTAGHCMDPEAGGGGVNEKWFAFNKKGEKKEIGKAVEFLNNEVADVGVIRVDNPGYWAKEGLTPVDPTVALWNEKEPEPKAVTGQQAPVVGNKSCMSGQRTGTSCGKILKLGVEVEGTKGLVEVEAESGAGDSGAPHYSEAAVGTMEGTNVGWKGENAVFEPLATSFEKLTTKLKLLTATNKVRHGFRFEAEAAPVTLTGKNHAGKALLMTTAGALECNEATYTGTQSTKEAIAFELTPAYTGCTLLGIPATVDINGCKYRFTTTKLEGAFREGSMDIVCPEGKTITVTAVAGGTPKCTIHVPSQNDLKMVTYTNTGAGATREITIDLNVGGLKYTHTAGSGPGACTFGGAENGFLAGPISITGENAGGAHVGVFTS